ncbi:permease [Rhizobium cauense]|nr:permease [Rhizobium cauense]
MDFMKLLKSLEDLLYEMVSWLVFYPITMWRSIVNPLRMMKSADEELGDREEDRYSDTLSPPLFLLLTLLLAQAISSAVPSIYADATLPPLLASTPNLLLARGVIFGMLPLVMAVTLARRKSVRLTRESLRPPFYSQCYVATAFVFVAGMGLDLILIPHHLGLTAGVGVLAVATVWYGLAQIRWFKHDLGISTAASVTLFLGRFLLAIHMIVAVALLIGWTLRNWK